MVSSFCLILALLGLNLLGQTKVIAQSSDTAQIFLTIESPVCLLNLKVYPEKRIPRIGNWDTLLKVSIYTTSNTFVAQAEARSGDDGVAIFDFCQTPPAPGVYNVYVVGFSHLRKMFTNKVLFTQIGEILDLTTGSTVLLAGETSNIYDNKINSLDASTQIRYFYDTTDEKNDLNRDGKVNSLDFSNTVFNFYKLGDPVL